MPDRTVHIIAIQERYLAHIVKQVQEVLGKQITIRPTTLREMRPELVRPNDIIFLSNPMIKGIVFKLVPHECPCIIANRSINLANCKELINLPPGQKILVVNDTKTNIEEAVASLRETIFEHDYYPYNPDENIPDDIDFIVTPGEMNLLPNHLIKVINIGDRILDIETFIELAELLGIQNQPQMVKRYIKSLVSLSLENEEIDRSKSTRIRDVRYASLSTFDDVIAVSTLMAKTVQLAKEHAKSFHPMHIYGEKGTGKSLLAQAIHHNFFQTANGFLTVNCCLKSIDMLEKELFGSEEGYVQTMGAFETARFGTVYLENVDELPFGLQIRVFQTVTESQFFRVGGREPVPFQARLIVSSSKALNELAEEGKFYRPFYEMLKSPSLKIPSLKERREDFVPLIEDLKRRINKTEVVFTDGTMDQLLQYTWPGNVTELYDYVTYLCSLGADPVDVKSLPLSIRRNLAGIEDAVKGQKINPLDVIKKIEEHGFLEESKEILKIFALGKNERTSFGRLTLKKRLKESGFCLSEQQIRMRMEILQEMGLLIVRQGRAGSTISQIGEEFLQFLQSNAMSN